MDKATEYLLLQEAEWQQVTNTLKSMIPTIQKAFLKPNPNTLKKIAKKLPRQRLKDIERDAIRRVPGFKKEYSEAKRKVVKLKFINKATARTAAMATALASAVTKKDVSGVIKQGEMGVRNAKILPIPGMFDLIALGLFITFIMAIFLTDGAVIIPAIKAGLAVIGMLVKILGEIIQLIWGLFFAKNGPQSGPAATDIIPGLKGMEDVPGPMGDDMSLQLFLQQDIFNWIPGGSS